MIDESRSDTLQSKVVESSVLRAIAGLDQAAWAQLHSIVERVNARWPVDGSTFRAPWDHGADMPEPLVGEVADFLHDRGLIVPGFDWVGWDQGRDLLNLYGIRGLAPQLEPAEVVGMIADSVGGDRTATGTLANSLENGFLPPLLGRLLDSEPRVGE